MTLRLPLTLAIIDGLLVSVGEDFFVLPLANTLECIELTREDIERANGKHVANVRGELIPYIRLRQHFNIHTERPAIEQIMVVETGEGRYGFVVDQVLGQLSDRNQKSGPVLPACPGSFRRHHSGQWNGGVDSRSGAAGAGCGAGHAAPLPRASPCCALSRGKESGIVY